MRAVPRLAAAVTGVLTVAISAACIVESPVYDLTVANVSDHVGYVRVTTSETEWFTVREQTRGPLTGNFGQVAPGWKIDVFDEDCALLGSFPMTFPRGSVFIGEEDARVREDTGWALAGQERFERASPTDASTCANEADPSSGS